MILGRGLSSTTMKPVMAIDAISATPNTPRVRCKEYFPFRISSAWVSSNAGHADKQRRHAGEPGASDPGVSKASFWKKVGAKPDDDQRECQGGEAGEKHWSD